MSDTPTAAVIRPDGSVELLTGEVDWEVLKEHVPGYLETVAADKFLQEGEAPAAIVWLDEDGHSRGLPANEVATAFLRTFSGAWVHGSVLGPVVVTGWHVPPEIDPETGDPDDSTRLLPLPLWVAEWLRREWAAV